MTATDTINIVKALKPRLGEKAAIELVRYIESAHTENLATKADVHAVRGEVQAVKADLAAVRAELKADLADVRAELKTELAQVRTELKTELAQVRAELKDDVHAVGSAVQSVRADLTGQMLALENRLVWKMLGGMGLMLAVFTGLIRFA